MSYRSRRLPACIGLLYDSTLRERLPACIGLLYDSTLRDLRNKQAHFRDGHLPQSLNSFNTSIQPAKRHKWYCKQICVLSVLSVHSEMF